MQTLAQRNYRFDNSQLEALKRQLLRDSEPVNLNPKAFDLLFVLVENLGRLLMKEDLFQLVWRDQIVEESNLTVNMSAIRKALGEKKNFTLSVGHATANNLLWCAVRKSAKSF